MGGEGPESPHFIDGKFLSPFLSSQPLSPRLCYGKGQRKDLTSKQSLDFSLIRTGLHPFSCWERNESFALGKRFAVAKLTASLSPRAKLRPRLLVASGRLLPSPEIQVSTGKDLLIPRGRAGLEASYLSPISPPFLLRDLDH
ncbi:hypothetical protein Lal_00001621 [Lupinus albus]|nr:hypothetical protein Lal_00001621 [Lupinus albus]